MEYETTKNLRFFKDDNEDTPFIFMTRDRAVVNEERWVLAVLSEKEAKEVYEFLSRYF